MEQVNRWMALAQLDGWGEEYRMLATIAARQMGCSVAELLPYDVTVSPGPASPVPAEQTLRALGRLTGF